MSRLKIIVISLKKIQQPRGLGMGHEPLLPRYASTWLHPSARSSTWNKTQECKYPKCKNHICLFHLWIQAYLDLYLDLHIAIRGLAQKSSKGHLALEISLTTPLLNPQRYILDSSDFVFRTALNVTEELALVTEPMGGFMMRLRKLRHQFQKKKELRIAGFGLNYKTWTWERCV